MWKTSVGCLPFTRFEWGGKFRGVTTVFLGGYIIHTITGAMITSARNHGVMHTFVVMCHPSFAKVHPFFSTSPAPQLDALTLFLIVT